MSKTIWSEHKDENTLWTWHQMENMNICIKTSWIISVSFYSKRVPDVRYIIPIPNRGDMDPIVNWKAIENQPTFGARLGVQLQVRNGPFIVYLLQRIFFYFVILIDDWLNVTFFSSPLLLPLSNDKLIKTDDFVYSLAPDRVPALAPVLGFSVGRRCVSLWSPPSRIICCHKSWRTSPSSLSAVAAIFYCLLYIVYCLLNKLSMYFCAHTICLRASNEVVRSPGHKSNSDSALSFNQ